MCSVPVPGLPSTRRRFLKANDECFPLFDDEKRAAHNNCRVNRLGEQELFVRESVCVRCVRSFLCSIEQ